MFRRDLYLDQLYEFIDKPFIKVLTGIRRSGKSAILSLLKEELLRKGVAETSIIHFNFESFEFSEIDTADKLYKLVKAKIEQKQPWREHSSYTGFHAMM